MLYALGMDQDQLFRFFESAFQIAEKLVRIDQQPHDFGVGEPITRTEIHLVSAIARQEGQSVTDLARARGVTKGAVSQVLQRLENKGLVEKRFDPDNQSRMAVFLTDKGRRADQGHQAVHDMVHRMFETEVGRLTPDQLAELQRFADRVDRLLRDFLAAGG